MMKIGFDEGQALVLGEIRTLLSHGPIVDDGGRCKYETEDGKYPELLSCFLLG